MRYFPLITLCVILSGCAAKQSPQQIQTSITNASMMTQNANCNHIAHNIAMMDNIIIQTSDSSSSNNYNTATSAVNTGLSQSGVLRKTPYLNALPGLARSFNTGNKYNQLERQQSSNAQREKTRLVSLFQQKNCVRTN